MIAEIDTSVIGFNTSTQRVVFEPPVCIPPDQVVVVTLYVEASTTGYASFAGNITGTTSPTYIYSFGGCGISGFVDLAQIGYPDRNWVQIVHANITCEGDKNNCPGDYNLDGTVDGIDFGVQLAAWGECDECPQDLDGDGLVNGNDVGLFLVAWGPCSQP